jgi:hypothetical protein
MLTLDGWMLQKNRLKHVTSYVEAVNRALMKIFEYCLCCCRQFQSIIVVRFFDYLQPSVSDFHIIIKELMTSDA